MTAQDHPASSPAWLHRADPAPVVPPPQPPVVAVKASLADREPVALGAAVQSIREVLTATLAVLIGFGIWTPDAAQIGLLLALYTALAAAMSGFITAWVRGRAWAPATVAKLTRGDQ